MQYDVDSPEAYLRALAPDWRRDTLLQLRELILRQVPDCEESIQYKMLCFRLKGQNLFHLNAQKGYVSLYVGDTHKIDPEGALLSGLNIGKGCIRFSKTKAVEKTNIAEFIDKTITLARQSCDIDC